MLSVLKDLIDFKHCDTKSTEARDYHVPPSLADKFAVVDYDHEHEVFELSDGRSLAACYEIFPVPTEGQSDTYVAEVAKHIAGLINNEVFDPYFPQNSPWVVQIFVKDDYDLGETIERYEQAICARSQDKQYTQGYLDLLKTHIAYLERTQGAFIDPMSNKPFIGRIRRVYVVIYRKLHSKSTLKARRTPLQDLLITRTKFESVLEANNIVFKRLDEWAYFKWLFRWFSPKPNGFDNPDAYLDQVNFPKSEAEKPLGFDVTQLLFSSTPTSNSETGTWYFDGRAHRYVPIIGFTKLPTPGQISAEKLRTSGENNKQIYAPLDKLPEGSVFCMSVVMQHQDYQKRRNVRLEKKARKNQKDYDVILAGQEAERANYLIAEGNHIYPVSMGIYLSGEDDLQLLERETQVIAELSNTMSLKAMPEDKDARRLDRYIRHLPMHYTYDYDQKYLLQSRLATTTQIAATFPLYGRSRGTGSALCLFSNRLGEPIEFDPLKDKQGNAHMLIFGSTGSGKSNLSAYLLMQALTVYLPRMLVIDAGGSFKYMVEYAKSMGVRVNSIEIKAGGRADASLNPFAKTKELLAQIARMEAINQDLDHYEKKLDEEYKKVSQALTEEEKVALCKEAKEAKEKKEKKEENRDYLMEFVSAAILMITGAEQKEIDAMNRQDRYLILEAIKTAAKEAVASGHHEMIPGDLARVLDIEAKRLGQSDSDVDRMLAHRVHSMASGLKTFIHVPLNAKYFNQRGEGLSDEYDLTYFELGLFKDDIAENEAPRALAVMKLVNDAMSIAEANKTSGRPFICYIDECHVVTSKPITAASIVQATKMGRKNSLWIWAATQNTKDFPESAARAISMMEYKLLLWSDQREREQIAGFTDLSDTAKHAYMSVTKVPGKYTEFILESSKHRFLCRNVPPREILTLAATDGDEQSEREALMHEYHCNGVEASFLMAQRYRGEAFDLEKIRRHLCQA